MIGMHFMAHQINLHIQTFQFCPLSIIWKELYNNFANIFPTSKEAFGIG
jgi:hypothetical protein